MIVDAEGLERFTREALLAAGLDGESAAAGADVLVRTTVRGVESHGIWFLDRYVRQLEEGGAKPGAQIKELADRGALLVLDGDGGHGPAVASEATRRAIERAREHGLGMVTVRNGNHFGAAGHYALMCAEEGCIGLAMANTNPIMAVTGSRSRVLGNSPLAFGAPREGAPPFVLDIAMSRVAGGKVRMAMEQGEQVPEGWIIGPDGSPTTSPEDFLLKRGALLPMEGHKGYGLALMVETLAGVLSGAAMASGVGNWLYAPESPSGTGFFFLAVDVASEGPFEAFQERLGSLCEEIVSAPRSASADRILVPGELEHEHEQEARANGLQLRGAVWSALEELARHLDLDASLQSIRRNGGGPA